MKLITQEFKSLQIQIRDTTQAFRGLATHTIVQKNIKDIKIRHYKLLVNFDLQLLPLMKGLRSPTVAYASLHNPLNSPCGQKSKKNPQNSTK